MELSARNQLRGRIRSLRRGTVMVEVEVDVGAGNLVVAAITVESADRLGLSEGAEVTAVVKATDVMISK
jgi:molybdopterin-binding protein